MRKKRIKVRGQRAFYHLMSRTVAGEALFGDREKEVLRKMIWQVAEFSGVRVITYAVMKNHFHILADVPPGDTEVSDRELVRRFRCLYPEPTPWQPMSADILAHHLDNNTLEGRQLRKDLTRRMHDISWYLKTLKQRFSIWFNKSKERYGTLWSERFKSVLIEGDQWALRTVAAYIDLNAVRAGLVDDPKDYRFCGYAEAVAGRKSAREGLRIIEGDLSRYRQTLYGYGSEEKEGKSALPRDKAVRVLNVEKGNLPLSSVLRCRVRYFTDGLVLGSPDFVNQHTPSLHLRRSKTAAHQMRGTDWKGLSVGTGLRKDIFR